MDLYFCCCQQDPCISSFYTHPPTLKYWRGYAGVTVGHTAVVLSWIWPKGLKSPNNTCRVAFWSTTGVAHTTTLQTVNVVATIPQTLCVHSLVTNSSITIIISECEHVLVRSTSSCSNFQSSCTNPTIFRHLGNPVLHQQSHFEFFQVRCMR